MNADISEKKYSIDFGLVEQSLICLSKKEEYLTQKHIDKIINFSKKVETYYNSKLLRNKKFFLIFKKRIIFIIRYIIKHKDTKLKKNIYNHNNKDLSLLYIIIPLIKICICAQNRKNIKKILSLLFKFCLDKVLPYKIFIITIEVILDMLTNILKSNNDHFYTINDEPFNLINDIVIALTSFPEEIKTENNNYNIIIDVINLLDQYLFSHNYTNIILTETPIWLKLLENQNFISSDLIDSLNNENIELLNSRKTLEEKLNSFLIKIYQFSLRSEYFENVIIKKSIIDLNYYLNSLNFLNQLIWKEIQSIPVSDFKIKEGNFIPKNKYIFLNDIKPNTKVNETSIIFSFKIFKLETNKDIDIFELFDQNMQSLIKLYINEKGFLKLGQSENKNLDTKIKIKENFCYFLCISISKNIKKYKGANANLFIYQKNTNDKELKKNHSSFQLEKINGLNLFSDISLALGKNNFFGVIGDFLMINKELTSEKCEQLFNLKEDYAKALRKIYYKFKVLPIKSRQNYRGGYNETNIYEKAKECFKKIKFKIVFDISGNEIYNIKSNKLLKNIDNNNIKEYPKNNIIINNNNYLDVLNSDNINTISLDDRNNKNKNFSISKDDIILFKNLAKMEYTYDIFYQCNGLDFLNFQIYNIFSKINDNKLLNTFLYEILSFIIKLISYRDKNFVNEQNQKPKFESEMNIFFLTLLNSLLNQKGKIYFNINLIVKLIEIYKYFKTNKLINQKDMILSILLDIDFYKNKEDIFQYKQIFDYFKDELEGKTNDNKSIFNKEFLYKILILDFLFETKKFNHKLLMEIISDFILYEQYDDKVNKNRFIHDEFISYFLNIKNEIKIYHYLKIIYFNFDKIKTSFIYNGNFTTLINPSLEKINYKHCKYCTYNQILFYLLYQEIINQDSNNNCCFIQTPECFIKNPSKLFLKCFLSQIFSLPLKERFKYIKLNSNENDYIFSLIDKNNEVFNLRNFSSKFENIINYLKSMKRKMDIKDTDLLGNIFHFFKIIVDFLKRITEKEIKSIQSMESQKTNKEKIQIHRTNLNNLLSSETIKKFFDIYISINININYKEVFKELNNVVEKTINYVSFPFYFWYFADKSIFDTSNNVDNKFQLFKKIINKLTDYKIIFDLNKDAIIIQNYICFMKCLYNFLINNNQEFNYDFVQEMILFLNNLKDNNFFYSKYIFEINLKNPQNKKEKKFILEIICDIYFHFYEKKNFDKVFQCLLEGIFLDKINNEIFNIDIQYFQSNNNKNKIYNFYNQDYFKNIENGEERQEIIFSIYFLLYLLEKYDNYIQQKNDSIPIEMISNFMNMLFDNCMQLFTRYNKKIKTNSLKNSLNEGNRYKIYFNLVEFIKNKYKTKNFCLKSIFEYYNNTKIKKDINIYRHRPRKYTQIDSSYSDYLLLNKILKYSQADATNFFEIEENENNSKLFFPKINVNERYKSFSHFSSRKTSFSEKCGFNDFDSKNEIKDDDSINKMSNVKLIQIKKTNNPREDNAKNIIHSFKEEKLLNNKEDKLNSNILRQKLNEINIPSIYYKKIFQGFNPNFLKKVFNPKEYYIWNKFNIILKDIIFSQKKFKFVSKLFEIEFKDTRLLKSSPLKNREFSLKYPTKIKNFVCNDYYRPFIKPDLNFFGNKLLKITHSYLYSKFLNDNTFEIDKIRKIEFPRIIPIKYDGEAIFEFKCEYINNNGSYFGSIYLNNSFLLFLSNNEKDPRKKYKSEMGIEKEKFYLYSYFLEERVIDKNKYIIMFYSELKEIVARKFCFNYIGLEFLMKNNKSNLFNFFNKDNYISFIKKMFVKIWENKPRNEKNDIFIFQLTKNITSLPIITMNLDEDTKFIFVQNLCNYFEIEQFSNKHLNGEISNFKYLLLINKYSSRSYNNEFQYLIFPLLYMDTKRKKERDLSKAIALNKESPDLEETIFKLKQNYSNFGCYFNTHYSTSGFVLYYLVRINPFTAGHIKLQSNKFDSPRRMFNSIENYLQALISSEENRELIPEFFHSYESFLNLNYNNLGCISDENKQIHDLVTGDKNGIAEFIINMRQQLERVNILPWIDNIFGCNQVVENESISGIYNIYPRTSYEKYNMYEEEITLLKNQGRSPYDIIDQIKSKINFLTFGICPLQLFNTSLKEKKIERHKSLRKSSISSFNSQKTKEPNFEKDLQKFLEPFSGEKYKIFSLDDSSSDNFGKALAIKSKKIINIFRLSNNENKSQMLKVELWQKKYLKIYPLSKMFCELSKDIFLSCRYLDKIIQINYSDKNNILIYFDNIITSVELLSHKEKIMDETNKKITHLNQVILGDEKGNLNLMKIEYEINNQKQNNLNEIKLKLIKSIKVHNSLINGILYVKRLNIIISYSEEGQITINNAFDFNIINIIQLGKDFYIKNVKISKYDLIYIYCSNYQNENNTYIKCYSLNGIKFTELETEKKIINFFVDETLLVVYENNLIEIFNLYDLDGNPLNKFEPYKSQDDIQISNNNRSSEKLKTNNKIILCMYNNVNKSLIIIYDDFQVLVEDV